MEWSGGQLLSSLLKRCHRNVHLEAVKEGLFHAEWECVREERRDWEDCADALSLLLLLVLSSSSPRSQKTHSHTLAKARSSEVHSHLLAFCRAQLATLSGALRGRVWRQEESREIEAEEEDEEEEEEDVDVYDEGRKKEQRER